MGRRHEDDFIADLAGRKPAGFLVVLSSPSGGGKTTIARAVLARRDWTTYSVSTTTRKQRPGEVDGHSYKFVTEEQFRHIADSGGFAEWARVHGNLYGTEKEFIEKAISTGFAVVMDIDIQGAEKIRKNYPEAVSIFIIPPDLKSLEARLRNRGTESPESFSVRMENARKECAVAPEYDYLVINDDLERAIEMVDSIIVAERMRTRRLFDM